MWKVKHLDSAMISLMFIIHMIMLANASTIIHHGVSAGDFHVEDLATIHGVGGDDALFGPIKTPIGFACECSWSLNTYVSLNGFILLGSPWITAPPSPSDVPTTTPTGTRVIAPFWTDMRYGSLTKVWVQIYYRYPPESNTIWNSNMTRIDELAATIAALSSFQPVQALVVTWENMIPMDAVSIDTSEKITFQVVLMTDAVHTHAVFNYGENTWDRIMDVSRYASMMYQCSSSSFYFNDMSRDAKIHNEAFNLTNSDLDGRWHFKLDQCPNSYEHSRHKCYLWNYNEFQNETRINIITNLHSITPHCPCSIGRVAVDNRFAKVPFGSGICYWTIFPAIETYGNRMCCYHPESAGLLITMPDAGFLSLYSPTRASIAHVEEDLNPYNWCVEESNGLANIFVNRRPVDDCSEYVSPSLGVSFGDPHMCTFDGSRYEMHTPYTPLFTFNGHGEYAMTFIEHPGHWTALMEMQGRLEKLVSGVPDTEIRATILTAVAAHDKVNGGYIHVEANLDKNGLVIFSNTLADPLDVTIRFKELQSKSSINHDNVVINKNSNTSLTAVFTNGVTLTVNIANGLLDISITIPDAFSGYKFGGLLGNYDGDPTNDFILPNGTVLSNDMSDREIYYYAEQWRTLAAESLFQYRSGYDHASYQDPDFVPIYLDELSSEDMAAAEVVCGTGASAMACIFDFIVTLDETLALSTKDIEAAADAAKMAAANTAPAVKFLVPFINVVVGVSVDIPFEASDVDNDVVTVFFAGPVSFTVTQSCTSSYTYTWIPDSTAPVNVSIYANDSMTTSSMKYLPVSICSGCSGNGVCDYGTLEESDVFCICYVGWGGNDCSTDTDGCADSPCAGGATCVDYNPTQQQQHNVGFKCICSTGYYLSHAERCVDINECTLTLGTSGCQQICVNTPGSFTCDCHDNHALDADGRSCSLKAPIDVNDCESNLCAQRCTNSEGAFTCSCYAGYALKIDGVSCRECDVGRWGQNCANTCGCAHSMGCDKVKGCQCQAGWKGTTCSTDVDECAAEVRPCSILEDCVNTEGSYSCVCKSGYARHNGMCTNIDECSTGHNDCNPQVSKCIDMTPHFTCQCLPGYTKSGNSCHDVDECSLNHECEHKCENVNGGFNCHCFLGYTLTEDRKTCSQSPDDTCEGHSSGLSRPICTDQHGADGCKVENGVAECFCNTGYILEETGCKDVDECLPNGGRGPCSKDCTNTVGGYSCSCGDGSKLLTDTISCQLCNVTGKWGIDCVNDCNCRPGSLYCDILIGCVCDSGWLGTTCAGNIDECTASPCAANQTCVDTEGSYVCLCISGYEKINGSCTDIDECADGTDTCAQNCVNTAGSYTCTCSAGFQLLNDSECVPSLD